MPQRHDINFSHYALAEQLNKTVKDVPGATVGVAMPVDRSGDEDVEAVCLTYFIIYILP
jgi:hypothetical protein